MKPLTQKEKLIRVQIIKELSRMASNGWATTRADDYKALEAKLRELNARRGDK